MKAKSPRRMMNLRLTLMQHRSATRYRRATRTLICKFNTCRYSFMDEHRPYGDVVVLRKQFLVQQSFPRLQKLCRQIRASA